MSIGREMLCNYSFQKELVQSYNERAASLSQILEGRSTSDIDMNFSIRSDAAQARYFVDTTLAVGGDGGPEFHTALNYLVDIISAPNEIIFGYNRDEGLLKAVSVLKHQGVSLQMLSHAAPLVPSTHSFDSYVHYEGGSSEFHLNRWSFPDKKSHEQAKEEVWKIDLTKIREPGKLRLIIAKLDSYGMAAIDPEKIGDIKRRFREEHAESQGGNQGLDVYRAMISEHSASKNVKTEDLHPILRLSADITLVELYDVLGSESMMLDFPFASLLDVDWIHEKIKEVWDNENG